MPSAPRPVLSALAVALVAVRCATPHQTVKPPPPASASARPVSDPPPSRVVIHATIFREAMVKKLAASVPRQGEGDADLVAGRTLHYVWQREPVALKFDRGRVLVTVPVTARFNFLGEQQIPITVAIAGEPVVTADFKALLQSSEVQVHVNGPVESVNRAIEGKLRDVITRTLEDFRFDLRPMLASTFARLGKPIEFTVGDQKACAELRIAAIEAAPTLLADGMEKDLGVVVLPSVTMPCTPVASAAPAAGSTAPAAAGGTAPATSAAGSPTAAATPGSTTPQAGTTAPAQATTGGTATTPAASGTTSPTVATASGTPAATATPVAAAGGSTSPAVATAGSAPAPATGTTAAAPAPSAAPEAAPAPLPMLANVASLPTGPFKVVVPVAARYEELAKALESSMHGRLFFSTTYPELFLEKPQVYPSDDTVVIRMQLGGKAAVAGVETTLNGEIYFSGHPHVIDNQITVPDLEITPGTADELVKLKFALDYASIRDQARQAMRVDVSERLAAVKDKLSTELSFDDGGACVRAQVLRSEVTGIYPHPSFLRIYAQVDAQTALYMPCKR